MRFFFFDPTMKKKIGKPKNQSILSFSPVLTLLFPYLSLARYRSKNDNLLSDSSLFINRTLKKNNNFTTSSSPPPFLPPVWMDQIQTNQARLTNISGSVSSFSCLFVFLPDIHTKKVRKVPPGLPSSVSEITLFCSVLSCRPLLVVVVM